MSDDTPASLATLTDMVAKARVAFPDHVPAGFENTLAASGATFTRAGAQLFEMISFDPPGIASMKKQLAADGAIKLEPSRPTDGRASMIFELTKAGLDPVVRG